MKEPNWKLVFMGFFLANIIALAFVFTALKIALIISILTNIMLLFFFGLSLLEERDFDFIDKMLNKIRRKK